MRAIGAARVLKTEGGSVRFTPGAAFKTVVGDALDHPTPLHRLTVSSNSISLLGELVLYGDSMQRAIAWREPSMAAAG